MPELKLHYFDFDGGRGEVARVALAIGGIEFQDERVPVSEWSKRRSETPLHALPVLEVDGEAITQSNAINRYVGKAAGLYPDDALEALRCDEIMDAVEDVVTRIVATFGVQDPAELRAAREALLAGPIRLYLEYLQERLRSQGGRFFAEDRLTVADLKVLVWVQQLRSGKLDHIAPSCVEELAPDLVAHAERVLADPGVRAYYEARSSQ